MYLVLDEPVGGHLVRLRHRDHEVGRADGPAIRELRQLRHVLRVALWCAAIRPLHERVAVGRRETAIVLEPAVLRIGVPRRHVPLAHLVADGFRPRSRVLVADERHRADLARPVARRAVLVEDGRNVFGKGRHRGRRYVRCRFLRVLLARNALRSRNQH